MYIGVKSVRAQRERGKLVKEGERKGERDKKIDKHGTSVRR